MVDVVVAHSGGLHMRVAATAVDLLARYMDEEMAHRVYLHAKNRKVPLTNLLAVVALQVRAGERVGLSIDGKPEDGDPDGAPQEGPHVDPSAIVLRTNTDALLQPIADYFGTIPPTVAISETVDTRIQEIMLTSQAVFNNMSHALVVVNRSNHINFLNDCAKRYLGISNPADVLGKISSDVIPHASLERVLSTQKPDIGQKQRIGKRIVLTTSTPIVIDGVLHGAMSVFQDISQFEQLAEELFVVKQLKEQLDLVLNTVHDAICVTDDKGTIRYVNPAYEVLHRVVAENILHRNVREVSPHGLRVKVLESGRPVRETIHRRPGGTEMVADVSPIYVQGQFKGIVSVTRSVSAVEELMEQVRTLKQETQYLKEELHRQQKLDDAFANIIGHSGALLDRLSVANKAARSNSTVLITGESGTGKELVARAIHTASARRDQPFIRVNCAGIPLPLMESELFGHERGAFTGAIATRRGKFELAQNGSLFLDEIGELPLEVQAKLLRVLQEREIERVGGERTIPLNVRVIVATNRDLEAEVKQRAFREDLYYRINVVRVPMPALRDRIGDIPLLCDYYVKRLADSLGKRVHGFTKEAMELMESHHWPGNVRELSNVIEYALNLCEGEWISEDHLPVSFRSPSSEQLPRASQLAMAGAKSVEEWFSGESKLLTMEEYERLIIARALEIFPSYNTAAKALGLTHKTVAAKAKKFGLVKRNK